MNESVLQALKEVLARSGPAVLDEPKKVEAMLLDLCGEQKREIAGVVAALSARVPQELAAAPASTPYELLESKLAARMMQNAPYTPEAVQAAVRHWAAALGKLPKALATGGGGRPPSGEAIPVQ